MKHLMIIIAVAAVLLAISLRGERATETTQSADIGGAFTLQNTDGKEVTEAVIEGKYGLVFFGFTYCPDICPTTLSTLTTVLERLDEQAPDVAAKLVPVFISVDPERDTPELMTEYMANFDSRIIGLTGTAEQVKQAAQAYKVYYALRKESPEQTDYAVDHSGFIYLMSPEGEYMRHFSHETSVEDMVSTLLGQMQ